MGQTKENFKYCLAYGEEGEKIIAEHFISQGFAILPLYQFDKDLAPKIFSKEQINISPDLTIFQNKQCFFIEAKRKQQWVKYGNELETGCDYRLYAEYKKITKVTGIKLFLVFLHEEMYPHGMYYINVNIKGRYWDGISNGKQVHKKMYFWKINQLTKLQ